MDLAGFLKTPLEIGGRRIDSRLVLAPMAGITHVAFRRLAAEYGGVGVACSEMSAARALPNENPKTSRVFRWREDEKPRLVWQILGADPDLMARAAARMEKEGFFGVDLNFGCSAPAITKKGGGAALLKDPERAGAMVAAVRKAISIPLFVKFRTGWEDNPEKAADLARIFEDNGADALTFHPRTAPDLRTRPPKWDYIRIVKKAVSIPVFGNGNVFCVDDCQRMLDQTGCDGVSIGRLAAVRPWIFSQMTGAYTPNGGEHLAALKRFAVLCAENFDPKPAMNRFKTVAGYMAADFAFGHTLNIMVKTAWSLEDALWAAESFFSDNPEPASALNPALLG